MRLIDYGSDIRRLESEREYTMMCRRAWLSYRWAGGADLKAIMRRALNGADMPELDGFDRFYEAVRRTTGHHERPEDVVLDMAGGAERALDYGCGNGWLAKELASKGMEVLGYDPDPTHQSRWKSLCRGAGKLRFTHEQGELAGTSKPVRYQFEGRTHPGSRSEARAWPAPGPIRSRFRASTKRSRTTVESAGVEPSNFGIDVNIVPPQEPAMNSRPATAC